MWRKKSIKIAIKAKDGREFGIKISLTHDDLGLILSCTKDFND